MIDKVVKLSMDTKTILNIISLGENEKTEFKQSFNRQAIETLVAFAKVAIGE